MSEPPILQHRRAGTVVLNQSPRARAADRPLESQASCSSGARTSAPGKTPDSLRTDEGLLAPARQIKTSRLAFWFFAAAFVLYNTIFVPSHLPSLPLLAGASLYPTDLLLGGLLLIALFYRGSNQPAVVRSPVSKYVLAFLLILVFETLYAIVILHRPPLPVLVTARVYAGYALFFPVVWTLGTIGGVKKLIRLWAVLAFAGAMLYVFEFFHGELAVFQDHAWLYHRELGATIGGGAVYSQHMHRLFSQGTVLFRIMLFVAFTLWLLEATNRPKTWLAVTVLLAVQVLLQFTRGMYLTSVATLLVMPIFVPESKARRRLVYVTIGAACAVVLIIVYKLASGGHSHLLGFIWDRFSRVFTHASSDASIQNRIQGAEVMISALSGHWLLGFGLGNGIHYGDSTYIRLLLDMGLVGTVVFLLLFGTASLRALRHLSRMPTIYERALLLGLTLSTVRMLINGLTQVDFAAATRIPALIISVALMEILIVRAQTRRPSQQPENPDGVGGGSASEVALAPQRLLAPRRTTRTDQAGSADG